MEQSNTYTNHQYTAASSCRDAVKSTPANYNSPPAIQRILYEFCIIVRPGPLGLSLQPDPPRGIQVIQVYQESPYKGIIQKGDWILSVNFYSVENATLGRLKSLLEADGSKTILVQRCLCRPVTVAMANANMVPYPYTFPKRSTVPSQPLSMSLSLTQEEEDTVFLVPSSSKLENGTCTSTDENKIDPTLTLAQNKEQTEEINHTSCKTVHHKLNNDSNVKHKKVPLGLLHEGDQAGHRNHHHAPITVKSKVDSPKLKRKHSSLKSTKVSLVEKTTLLNSSHHHDASKEEPPSTNINIATTASRKKKHKGSSMTSSASSSHLRGVTMRPSGRWQAQFYFAGKSQYIGVFDSREKAALAYEIAREHLKNRKARDQSEVDARISAARKAAFEGVNRMRIGSSKQGGEKKKYGVSESNEVETDDHDHGDDDDNDKEEEEEDEGEVAAHDDHVMHQKIKDEKDAMIHHDVTNGKKFSPSKTKYQPISDDTTKTKMGHEVDRHESQATDKLKTEQTNGFNQDVQKTQLVHDGEKNGHKTTHEHNHGSNSSTSSSNSIHSTSSKSDASTNGYKHSTPNLNSERSQSQLQPETQPPQCHDNDTVGTDFTQDDDSTPGTQPPPPSSPTTLERNLTQSPAKSNLHILSFEQRFQELKAFIEKYGHCNINRNSKIDKSLGRWCEVTRSIYRNQHKNNGGMTKKKRRILTEEDIERLEGIGFKWTLSPKTTHSPISTTPHSQPSPPSKHHHHHHHHHGANGLTSSPNALAIDTMEADADVDEDVNVSIEDPPSPDSSSSRGKLGFFDEQFQQLVAFHQRYGHCDVPSQWKNNPALGLWCFNLRQAYQKLQKGKRANMKLSKMEIDKLESLGFKWRV